MRIAFRIFFVAILILLGAKSAQAQYYSWGSDAPMRWQQFGTDSVRIIVPDTAEMLGRRTLHYVQAVRPSIGYGFRLPPLRIPFIFHTENFQSNAMVMWMPKRIDFLSTPAADGYSMPWAKQLVAHEYRHAVQYNNLNRGIIRVLSYLFGQQGATLGIPFMYFWILEGDAVMSETEMSSFGRGRQPRFTLEYRAIGRDILRLRNCDKWFCGSYLEYVPDHYQLGYQMVRYSYDRYGREIWDRTLRYAVRNAYMLTFSTGVGLRKLYDTSEDELFRDSFEELNRLWDSLPKREDSGRSLMALPARNYTIYAHPVTLNDTTLVSLKKDFDHTDRLIAIDIRTGNETVLGKTGLVSSRPTTDGRKIWWTEYRRSLLFPERVGSRICCLDLTQGHPRTVPGIRNALYPTPTEQESLAWAEYTPDGRYAVVIEDSLDQRRRIPADGFAEIHGLAWDDATCKLYTLMTDDSGMWIGRVDSTGIVPLTKGAYITLSDLRAGGGRLYFGSIASGLDEAHCLDLTDGQEYRLSTSTYGSFSPAPDRNGGVWTTTYERQGYRITCQETVDPIPVTPSQLPVELVNPQYSRWEVVNLDTVRFTGLDSIASQQKYKFRRYRRATHLFNLHSWAPLSFDPFGTIEEFSPDAMLGATVLTQNLLANTDGYATWGWSRANGHRIKGEVRYTGLGVHLDLNASYGGDQMVYGVAQQLGSGEIERQPMPKRDKYWSVGADATLPLYFDRGYHVRQLSIQAGWNYSNGLVANVGDLRYNEQGEMENLQTIGYRHGLHKLSFGIGFSDVVRSAYRDVGTPWGYLLQASYDLNPTNRDFSDLFSCYARVYTPGFFARNSLSVGVAYQTSIGGYRFPSGMHFLGYKSTRLLPKGFTSADISSNNYIASAVDYQFPLCYPEGGIPGFLYIKRIRINVGLGYAQFQELGTHGREWRRLYSYGGDIYLDLNLLREPEADTWALKLSFYQPNRGSFWFGAGLELPF